MRLFTRPCLLLSMVTAMLCAFPAMAEDGAPATAPKDPPPALLDEPRLPSWSLELSAGPEVWLPSSGYAFDKSNSNGRAYRIKDSLGLRNATGYRYRARTKIGPVMLGAALRQASGSGMDTLGLQDAVFGTTTFGSGTGITTSVDISHYSAYAGFGSTPSRDGTAGMIGVGVHLFDFTYRLDGFSPGGSPVSSTDRHQASDVSAFFEVSTRPMPWVFGVRGELSIPIVSQIQQIVTNVDYTEFQRAYAFSFELSAMAGVQLLPNVDLALELGVTRNNFSRGFFESGGTSERSFPDWTSLWSTLSLTVRF